MYYFITFMLIPIFYMDGKALMKTKCRHLCHTLGCRVILTSRTSYQAKDSYFIKIQIVFFIESENLNTVECFGILNEWFPFILNFNLLSQTFVKHDFWAEPWTRPDIMAENRAARCVSCLRENVCRMEEGTVQRKRFKT